MTGKRLKCGFVMLMKRNWYVAGATWAVATLGASAVAQTNPTPSSTPAIINRPTITAPAPSTEPLSAPPRPERPGVPGRPLPASGMQELVRDFQAARQSYIQQQQELNRKLASATEEQRAILREQIKDSLKEWRELQKQQAKELREQAKDIKNNTPNLRDVIDSGGGDGRGR